MLKNIVLWVIKGHYSCLRGVVPFYVTTKHLKGYWYYDHLKF